MDTEHQISLPAFSEAEIMFLFLALQMSYWTFSHKDRSRLTRGLLAFS